MYVSKKGLSYASAHQSPQANRRRGIEEWRMASEQRPRRRRGRSKATTKPPHPHVISTLACFRVPGPPRAVPPSLEKPSPRHRAKPNAPQGSGISPSQHIPITIRQTSCHALAPAPAPPPPFRETAWRLSQWRSPPLPSPQKPGQG